jgi:lipid-binding SYLF domain-containing protein
MLTNWKNRTGWALLAGSLVVMPAFAGDEASHRADAKNASTDAKKIDDETERAMKAAEVLEAAATSEDASIPNALLEKAWGIAVIPHVVKGAFGIGGRWGKGLVVQRLENGGWSAPAYVSVGGASYGFQIGVDATDLVLVFTDRSGLQSLLDDGLKLGADAGVTAGPLGRRGEIGTNLTLDSAIYSYSRSKGLFAGIALDGAVVTVDEDANHKVYGKDVTASTLLSGKVAPTPVVSSFHTALKAHVPARKA